MRQQKVSLQDILEARKLKKLAKGKVIKSSSSNDRLGKEDQEPGKEQDRSYFDL